MRTRTASRCGGSRSFPGAVTERVAYKQLPRSSERRTPPHHSAPGRCTWCGSFMIGVFIGCRDIRSLRKVDRCREMRNGWGNFENRSCSSPNVHNGGRFVEREFFDPIVAPSVVTRRNFKCVAIVTSWDAARDDPSSDNGEQQTKQKTRCTGRPIRQRCWRGRCVCFFRLLLCPLCRLQHVDD